MIVHYIFIKSYISTILAKVFHLFKMFSDFSVNLIVGDLKYCLQQCQISNFYWEEV